MVLLSGIFHLIEILALKKWSFKPIGLLIRGLFKRNPLYHVSLALLEKLNLENVVEHCTSTSMSLLKVFTPEIQCTPLIISTDIVSNPKIASVNVLPSVKVATR